jgi:hypothetical protein
LRKILHSGSTATWFFPITITVASDYFSRSSSLNEPTNALNISRNLWAYEIQCLCSADFICLASSTLLLIFWYFSIYSCAHQSRALSESIDRKLTRLTSFFSFDGDHLFRPSSNLLI